MAALALGSTLLLRSGGEKAFTGISAVDPGPIHVHGLGLNPADGALYIATHTGLFRLASGASKAVRVTERHQDTMGFTIAGPDRFLGSGHPDLNEARDRGLPALLGLIESRDRGRSWQPVSLSGGADFHVLRFAGERVYGYDATNDRLLASSDGGRSWRPLARPGLLVDLAVNPHDARRLVAAAAQGLYASQDGGARWRQLEGPASLLAWPASGPLYAVAGGGLVFASADGGATLERRGDVGGQPAALLAVGRTELYVALHDGTIVRSADGGRTWRVRATP